MRAVELSKNFLRVCKNDAPSIAEKISSAYKEKIERNRSALISIIKTIILCGKQNIALRGKTDDSSNFRELLKFRAETDEALNYHLQNSPPNAKYISHQTQNDFIYVVIKLGRIFCPVAEMQNSFLSWQTSLLISVTLSSLLYVLGCTEYRWPTHYMLRIL
ncbi:hypothetical protein KUTeg_001646 [Tegillarca granosa]|uniref:Uncharacterized protein n=1 Tax=Tegillarca granosa TaxID=220873 RepID=A0ABQ9FS19_TEGGR|nr:hypothetical protein KUTeg_001646 [Tegillarca granosa]